MSLGLWLLALGVAALAPTAAPSPASAQHFQPVGPGGGGALFFPAISPHDPRRILVACDMTGSYISNDAGESWHMFNLQGRVRFFVFDPQDANVIYAASVGLWRSTNGGMRNRGRESCQSAGQQCQVNGSHRPSFDGAALGKSTPTIHPLRAMQCAYSFER